MTDDTVTVPRTIEYESGQPLPVSGPVVGVLYARPASRRITVLVEEPATDHEDGAAAPERVTIEEESYVNGEFLRDGESLEDKTYRQLQEAAKKHGIKANQQKEDLREALREELE